LIDVCARRSSEALELPALSRNNRPAEEKSPAVSIQPPLVRLLIET
jgi:hypothetical protein